MLLSGIGVASAQWTTQSIDLKPGWNGVFLHVDATHDSLNALVGGDASNPILEIWRWNPPSVAQFVDSPAQPTPAPEWATWLRSDSVNSQLQRLSGDSAYLVRVGSNVTSYVWNIKGRPVAPRHDWTISGLNLIGFPTVTNNPPKFDTFLSQAPALQSATPEIYAYSGGELSSNNPALIRSPFFRVTPVKRGQAYWMRSGTVFNRYFGPFEVIGAGTGVDFHTNLSSATLRLRNLSSSNLTVTLRLGNSAVPPSGQTPIAGVPPLLLRGSLNPANLTYGHTNIPVASPRTWTLAPRDSVGSEVEVVLGLNRSAITSPAGSLLAGILSFTDSLGVSEILIPVSATTASSAGLWVGGASITQVGKQIKRYQTNEDGSLLVSTNGNYSVTTNDTSLGEVSKAYPLRLIVHNPVSGAGASLLQRVYHGLDYSTNPVVATGEAALHPSYLSSARRITSTHLPWTATNTVWPMGGRLGTDTFLSTRVMVSHNDRAANPFLHVYHPDHDNLDVTFKKELPQGSESYRIERFIQLAVLPPANDFSSLIASGTTVSGIYLETLTLKGLHRDDGKDEARQYELRGVFSLNRVSDISTLTLAR